MVPKQSLVKAWWTQILCSTGPEVSIIDVGDGDNYNILDAELQDLVPDPNIVNKIVKSVNTKLVPK